MTKKTINKKLRMLVIRPVRDSALVHFKHYKNILVDYVILSDKPYAPSINIESENLKVENLSFVIPPKYKLLNRLIPYYNLEWKIGEKEIEEKIKKADVVNVTDTYYFYTAQAARLAGKYNKPLVATIWMTLPNHITTWFPPYSLNTKAVVRNTGLFVLRNKTAIKFTDSLNIPRQKTKVVYEGVDTNLFKPGKLKTHKKLNILFVGVLVKSKGIDDLSEVFKKLYKKHKNIELRIVGTGPLENKLHSDLLGLPVKFFGFIPYRKLAKVYGNSDIFCAPSKYDYFFGLKTWEEYFSYVLMEAQAAGLPVVTTKTGGIPEEVDKRNYIIEQGNREQLYNALEELILSKEKRKSLGKINRARALKMFNAKIQASKTEEAILQFLKNN